MDYRLKLTAKIYWLSLLLFSASLLSNSTAQTNELDAKLFAAVGESKVSEVEYYLKQGANPNSVNNYGWTPLHMLARWSEGYPKDSLIVQLLIQYGAKINAKTNERDTPLHLACWNENTTVARWLLALGAKPNLTDKDGNTPLHIAAYMGTLPMIKLLLAHQADPTIENLEGKTAAKLAQKQGKLEVYRYLTEIMSKSSTNQ